MSSAAKWLTIFAILVFACTISTIHFSIASPANKDLSITPILADPTFGAIKTVSGIPTRITIPKINLDVAIEPVGLTADGAMNVPNDASNAGWYSLGNRPGEIGNAVIVGHFGNVNSKNMIFNRISELDQGDRIEIKDDQNETYNFIVQKSQSFDPLANTSDIFNSSDGKAHLNLITCQGIWNNITKEYSKRIVVFSDQE